MTVRLPKTFLVLLALTTAASAAETRYITDVFDVTMRSGTSTSNEILRMLDSGTAVTVLESDIASKYSLVETDDGKTGYVISRFLVTEPAARETLKKMRETFAKQKTELLERRSEIKQLGENLDQERSDNLALKNALRASEEELTMVRNASTDALDILEQRQELQLIVDQLKQQEIELTSENSELKDSTGRDWLVRGAAVSFVAFIIGILVTQIRWKRKDSWGSY